MKKILLPLLTLLVLGATLRARTLDEVLAMNYQARGGLDKLKAIAGWKLSGRMSVASQGLDLPVTIWRKAPDKMRVETVLQEKKVVQACDGPNAWWIMPFLADDAQAMPAEQGRLFREQAEFADPLVVFAAKGDVLELQGEEELDGKPVFKLKRIKADGGEIFHFLDAASGLELKSSRRVKTGGTEALAEILYGDPRPVNGVVMPFAIENRLDGQAQIRLTFDGIEADPDMADDLFAMPDRKIDPGRKEAPGAKEAPVKKEAPRKKGRK